MDGLATDQAFHKVSCEFKNIQYFMFLGKCIGLFFKIFFISKVFLNCLGAHGKNVGKTSFGLFFGCLCCLNSTKTHLDVVLKCIF